jgi:hypothetical protein
MAKKFGVRSLGSADVRGQPDAQITAIITKEKNKMPAFDEKLTKEQIGEWLPTFESSGKALMRSPLLSESAKTLIRM